MKAQKIFGKKKSYINILETLLKPKYRKYFTLKTPFPNT